jgi:hypothetical protein
MFFKNGRLGYPLQNPMGSKMAPKSTKWRKNVRNSNCGYAYFAFFFFFFKPSFHETIVILVPLGFSFLKKVIFSIEIGYFSVFVAFLCALFYTTCSSLSIYFSKNIGKRPAVEPSVF